MRSRLLLSATVLALAVSPALATTPGTQVTIGNFLYEFEGATYDGVATTFSY